MVSALALEVERLRSQLAETEAEARRALDALYRRRRREGEPVIRSRAMRPDLAAVRRAAADLAGVPWRSVRARVERARRWYAYTRPAARDEHQRAARWFWRVRVTIPGRDPWVYEEARTAGLAVRTAAAQHDLCPPVPWCETHGAHCRELCAAASISS